MTTSTQPIRTTSSPPIRRMFPDAEPVIVDDDSFNELSDHDAGISTAPSAPRPIRTRRRVPVIRRRAPSYTEATPKRPLVATGTDLKELTDFAKLLASRNRPENNRPVFYEFGDMIMNQWFRNIMASLKPAEIAFALAVIDRSLRWGNFAKIVTWEQFENGVRDAGGDLKLDTLRNPVHAGTGISARYCRSIAKSLVDRRLLDRVRVVPSGTFLWFPCPREEMRRGLVKLGVRREILPRLLKAS